MGWFDDAGRWIDEKYEGTKEWVKKNADDIDLITDFIPVVGQVKDAYNTIKFGWRCYKDPSDENLLELGFVLIGWVPYAGDTVKGAFKVLRTHPDGLLALARKAMSLSKNKKYGNPEEYLYDLISVSSLTKGLDEAYVLVRNALQGKWGTEYILRKLKEIVDSIKSLLSRVSNALKKYLDKYLPKNPPSSAAVPVKVKPASPAKPAKPSGKPAKPAKTVRPESKTQTGTQGTNNPRKGNSSTNAILDTLVDLNIGAVGEHMADYWIAEQLGVKGEHDSGKPDSGHKNKSGGLNKLRIGANNPGIDSIWQTDSKSLGSMRTSKYAIIEAKSSLSEGTGSGPGTLLADNGAKRARQQKKKAAAAPKVKVAKDGSSGSGDTPREKEMKDQQMSEEWVDDRLRRGSNAYMVGQYSRHLIYYNAIQGKEHYAALAKNLTAPDANLHKNPHTPTRYWDDAAIEKALKSRVNKPPRKKKS